LFRFFRTLRQRLLAENRVSRYLLYAFGEILLVVIGILIAFQIDSWNEKRKYDKELANIYERLILDVENDLGEFWGILAGSNREKAVFLKVMNDSVSADLFDAGLSRLVTNYFYPPVLNTTGIQQLKGINSKNPLALRLIDFYDEMDRRISLMDADIKEQSNDLIKKLRDSPLPWFAEWMRKNITKDNSSAELQDYFLNSPEYKNYVAKSYNDIYNNYVPLITIYTDQLMALREELKLATDGGYRGFDREKLQEFSGIYEVSEIACPTMETGVEPGTKFRVVAREHSLRIIGLGLKDSTEILHKSRDAFLDVRQNIVSYNFKRDDSLHINGFSIEVDDQDVACAIILTKQEE
jgi:hypothetical protein